MPVSDSHMPKSKKNSFRVVVDDTVTAMLLELAEACQCDPSDLIAALVEDVLMDDYIAHNEADDDVEILTIH